MAHSDPRRWYVHQESGCVGFADPETWECLCEPATIGQVANFVACEGYDITPEDLAILESQLLSEETYVQS